MVLEEKEEDEGLTIKKSDSNLIMYNNNNLWSMS